VRAGGRIVVFDAGTGIIKLGRDLMREEEERRLAIFFSHSHHDHTGGILHFKPVYVPSSIVTFLGSGGGDNGIMADLERLSSTESHPVQLAGMGMRYACVEIGGGDVVLWAPGEDRPRLAEKDFQAGPGDVLVRILENPRHPLCGVLNFRLEYAGRSYVYATDVEGYEECGDPVLAEFARGADLMSHDGQYSSEDYARNRKGWGHSTVNMAIRTAVLAGVPRLAIVHHEPEYDDAHLLRMEREAQRIFPGVFFARENQEALIP
ncbi:MAG: MBL fold metallo-hydrolase, partial [Planctomycetota bacterium]|jgi:ribonuclease BN (tRNA processing enzyme)|nr:MBL fold metallo-hydrolase [Planctomycetota bacterium]